MVTKKKMQDGGPIDAMRKAMGEKPTSTKKTMKYVKKHGSGYIPPAGKKMQSGGTSGGYPTSSGNMPSGGKMMTGGMVNANANLQAGKKAGSKGVTPGVNPKAAASKVAKGRSGGTSVAPKTALPKAQMGKIVKMANTAKKTTKGVSKTAGSLIDFRKAATKSDMAEALKRTERAKLKKQLQDLEKSRKG